MAAVPAMKVEVEVEVEVARRSVGGHTIVGTRIWCDRAPYDVAEEREEVHRLLYDTLREVAVPGTTPTAFVVFTKLKDLLPVALAVDKISAIEDHVER